MPISRASKSIILCCDGTNNEFGRVNTNVVRLFQSLERGPAAAQVAYYDPGIGTMAAPGAFTRIGKDISRAAEMGFGIGIISKIESALSFLMHQYQPGDKVFIFGFSRGAYTARALAGALHKCGLPEDGADNLLPYFMRMFQDTTNWKVGDDFKATFGRRCHVHFLGLWDTVSTIGWVYNPKHFPYTRSNPNVSFVRHAVALDERRCFFRTNLWGLPDREPTANLATPEQDALELWFPGVHCDVGGGYPEQDSALWKISFAWMIRQAEAVGLRFDQTRVDQLLSLGSADEREWPQTRLHESLSGAWWICEVLPKKYWDLNAQPPRYRFRLPLGSRREVPAGALLHRSVIDRMLARADYRPRNLDPTFVSNALATAPPTEQTITYLPSCIGHVEGVASQPAPTNAPPDSIKVG
jgi:uncharacterized protein (DUF2235 family)